MSKHFKDPKPSLTHFEFSAFLAASFVLSKHRAIPTDAGFHESLAKAFNADLEHLQRKFHVAFRIRPDLIHGKSQTVADILHSIVGLRRAHYECPGNGTLFLDETEEEAESVLSELTPDKREIIKRIASATMEKYRPEPALLA